MPSPRRAVGPMVLVAALLGAGPPSAARAAPLGPTDACLARRLDAAGAACRTIVDAWASSIGTQHLARRARRVDDARRLLGRAWDLAGRRAARQDASCGRYAPDVARVADRLADFAAAEAAAVVAGIAPDTMPAHRRCATRLLRTASRFCAAVLAGEASRRRRLANDGAASADTRAVRRARARLRAAFARIAGDACPTNRHAEDTERAIAGLGLGVAASLTRPNILWVVGDDMNLELGAYGDPVAVTPTLDALAAQGARFTGAFATAGVCAPARAALITGMHATSLGACRAPIARPCACRPTTPTSR